MIHDNLECNLYILQAHLGIWERLEQYSFHTSHSCYSNNQNILRCSLNLNKYYFDKIEFLHYKIGLNYIFYYKAEHLRRITIPYTADIWQIIASILYSLIQVLFETEKPGMLEQSLGETRHSRWSINVFDYRIPWILKQPGNSNQINSRACFQQYMGNFRTQMPLLQLKDWCQIWMYFSNLLKVFGLLIWHSHQIWAKRL